MKISIFAAVCVLSGTDISAYALPCVFHTLVWVFEVLRDVVKVMRDIRLQSSRVGEEPGHQAEQSPTEGTAGSVENTEQSENNC